MPQETNYTSKKLEDADPTEVAEYLTMSDTTMHKRINNFLVGMRLNSTSKENNKAPVATPFAYEVLWAKASPTPTTVGGARKQLRLIVGALKMGVAFGRRYTFKELEELFQVGEGGRAVPLDVPRPAARPVPRTRPSGRTPAHWAYPVAMFPYPGPVAVPRCPVAVPRCPLS